MALFWVNHTYYSKMCQECNWGSNKTEEEYLLPKYIKISIYAIKNGYILPSVYYDKLTCVHCFLRCTRSCAWSSIVVWVLCGTPSGRRSRRWSRRWCCTPAHSSCYTPAQTHPVSRYYSYICRIYFLKPCFPHFY